MVVFDAPPAVTLIALLLGNMSRPETVMERNARCLMVPEVALTST